MYRILARHQLILSYISAICGFRLDFEMFTTRGPTLTTEADNTYYCRDTLEVSSTTVSTYSFQIHSEHYIFYTVYVLLRR